MADLEATKVKSKKQIIRKRIHRKTYNLHRQKLHKFHAEFNAEKNKNF